MGFLTQSLSPKITARATHTYTLPKFLDFSKADNPTTSILSPPPLLPSLPVRLAPHYSLLSLTSYLLPKNRPSASHLSIKH